MWTLNYIFSQFFAILAIISLILTYFIKNRKLILTFSLLSSVSYGLQYLLLSATTGFFINLIGVVRGIWLYAINGKSQKQEIVAGVVLILANIVVGVLTYAQWYSFIIILASLIYTVSVCQENLKVYHWLALPTSLCSILYNVFCNSIFGIVSEITYLVILIMSLIKYYNDLKIQLNKMESKIE